MTAARRGNGVVGHPPKRLAAPPEWIKPGVVVDYHSVIGGPVTQPAMVVRNGPQKMGGDWVVWLEGKAGCVAVEACTPAAAAPPLPPPPRSLPAEIAERLWRGEQTRCARDRAREVLHELTRGALKGEGPALGLDPITLAEVHEGIAAELRRGVEDAKRAAKETP